MKRSGFTLIELSIVLVIIGLIIGGVVKGQDLIRGAEQKKILNTWVKGWQVAVNTYRDRTGNVLSDGVMNGGTEPITDSFMDRVRLDTTTTVQSRLKEVGIDVPTSNVASTNGGGYEIKGKYSARRAYVKLTRIGSNIDGGTQKNKLAIRNLPIDVAIAWDTMVDGEANPSRGAFRRDPDNSTGTDGTANTWPDAASTFKTVNVSLEL